MVVIKLSVQSTKQDVAKFLNELKKILSMADFDIATDLIIIKAKKKKEIYSTPYTLLNLDYDNEDVADRLKELSIEEYSETLIDKDDLNPPLLFVFGKNIDNKLIYIKLKIKGDRKRYILCVSFHYAEKSMKFPFA